MECFRAREALSALLDGEDPGVERDVVRPHLDSCPACSRWQEDAAGLDRRMRLAPATTEGEPDLAARVLPNVRLPRPRRWPAVVRAALAVVALAQLGIAAANLAGPLGLHTTLPSAHMSHEVTAFNLAFGVALLGIAHDSRRANGQLPLLTSFLVVLAAVSTFDLSSGNVGWSRLATHAPIVLGLLLTVVLSRAPANPPNPGAGHTTRRDIRSMRPPAFDPGPAAQPQQAREYGPPAPPVARQDDTPWRHSA